MASLVPIPWQPHLFLTPRTLSYLKAASRRVGRNLYLYDAQWTRISPAWRSFAQQLTAWLRWLARLGPVASSPYTGQRNHMRGAAFDLRETSASVQAACRYVGLVRDPSESWHWNDPLWRSMPIIKTNTATTSGIIALLTSTEQTMQSVASANTGNYYVFDSAHGWKAINRATAAAINAKNSISKSPRLEPEDIHILQDLYGPWN